MDKQDTNHNWIAKLKLRWYLVLRGLLNLWVKPRIKADPDGNFGSNGDRPVCYVMDSYALSSILILDNFCEKQNLARVLLPVPGIEESPLRSYAVLKRLRVFFSAARIREAIPGCCNF